MIAVIVFLVLVFLILAIYSKKHSNSDSSPHIHRFIVNGKPFDVDVSRPIDTDSYISNIEKETARLQAKNRDWAKRYNLLMEYQNNGIQYEKQGIIDKAIMEYNKAIDYGFRFTDDFGINNFLHSMERLMILYRKRKDYDNELRIIDLALNSKLSENDRKSLEYRKERTILLKNKLRHE